MGRSLLFEKRVRAPHLPGWTGQCGQPTRTGSPASLLAAEITAKTGKDPGEIYEGLTREFGVSYFDRVEGEASREELDRIKSLKWNRCI